MSRRNENQPTEGVKRDFGLKMHFGTPNGQI